MAKKSWFFALTLAAAALCGCSSITNLTPTRYARTQNGFYRVEAEWKSDQQSIRPGSFQPAVVIGFEKYPMRAIPLVKDRWEAYVPAKVGQGEIVYHYQFDYLKNAFHEPAPDSKQSAEYTLKIVDRK